MTRTQSMSSNGSSMYNLNILYTGIRIQHESISTVKKANMKKGQNRRGQASQEKTQEAPFSI